MAATAQVPNKITLIKSHIFEDLTGLRFLGTSKRNYVGKQMSIGVLGTDETLTYLDVKTENQIDGFTCFLKKNIVIPPKNYQRPITVGLDTSYGNQNYIIKGNATYGWSTVLMSMVDGNVSEQVIEEVRKLTRYVIMMSDKVYQQKQGKSMIVPHHYLQDNMFNMLKVVSEGKMIAEPLQKVTGVLAAYGYKYEKGDKKRSIILKDGPLLSGFFEPFGNALLTGNIPERFEDEYDIYKTIALAGIKGIPIVGLTKHPTYSILSQHFGENDVLDYSIVKQIADNDTYFYLGPYERKHNKNPKFKIHYYYLYLEDRFSPLRLEIIPSLLPKGLNPNEVVEDILISLKISDDGEISNNGEDYKLPACIATVDQITREIVKKKSAELYEALDDVRKKIPGAILDRRR